MTDAADRVQAYRRRRRRLILLKLIRWKTKIPPKPRL